MSVLEPLWSHSGGDSLYNRMSANQLFRDTNPDQELEIRTRKADKFSECLHVVANEPSLAFFRIQEHVRKSLPQLVEQKHEINEIQQKVQGCCFDAEYATNAVKNLQKSSVHFQNIQDLLKNAMFMKQQIDYEETKSYQGMAPSHTEVSSTTTITSVNMSVHNE
ncbi:hypothetical protein CHS0354_013331 [Potamilus streckersoni]|uniref:BLOC-1-related complex subunit 8 n=1 Tax=Potamilus streckersoni TaxID=2493646 RepID=A0AAE0W511_9BIVA|nr:hypothetical protein CHS0354_013331 [Potamilus streckersoni]